MRKKKTTFLIILLISLIAVGLLSIEKKLENSGGIKLADYSDGDLERISFICGGDIWSLIYSEGAWKTEGNRGISEASVNTLTSALLKFSGELIADENADKSVYGINDASVHIKYLETDGGEKEFVLGNKTPAATEYYLADNAGRVYSVISMVGSAMETKKSRIVDSYIYGIDYSDISRIEVDGEPPIKLAKKQDRWSFESTGYTENISVEKIRSEVTRYLGGMYALEVYDETDVLNDKCGFGSGADICTVTITSQQNNKDKIYIGKKTDKGVYIKINDKKEIYLVIKDYFKFINLFREVVM